MGIFDIFKNQKEEKSKSSKIKSLVLSNDELDFEGQFGETLHLLEKTNDNYFITGKAGTGKSTLLKCFKEASSKKIICLAPTGIAAINIGGQTIHSFFGFPPRALNEDDIYEKADKTLYKAIDTLIIDEISMVRADLLDAVDQFLCLNRVDSLPFGGVQVLFFGDIFQLQPVVRTIEEQKFFSSFYKSPYFFDAKVFDNLNYKIIDLKKVFRQKDPNFINILDSVRLNKIDNTQLTIINSRYQPNFLHTNSNQYITLTSTNQLATDINEYHLNLIVEEEFSFLAKIEGDFEKRSYPTDAVLSLKKGAQIMFVKNDFGKRWVNGTIGKISNIGDDFIEASVVENGHEYIYSVGQENWEIRRYRYDPNINKLSADIVGIFTQYPLKLAWAITIHKSQGLTFDNIVIDLGRGAFAHGQTYVALSRCTNLEGIILEKKVNWSDIIVDLPVRRFYSARFENYHEII